MSLAALATAATSWALPGPIVTRGSAALPLGCGPATVGGLVTARASADSLRVVYVVALPSRGLAPHQVELRAGLLNRDKPSQVRAIADCTKMTLLTWTSTPLQGKFTAPGPCPKPKNWSSRSATVACAGLPTAWETSDDFTVKSTAQARGRCNASAARSKTVSLLHALDYGQVVAFAEAFLPHGTFKPYTASITRAYAGRTKIATFAKQRIAAADGWTATSVLGPIEKTKKTSTFAVTLVAYSSGRPVGAGTARMTLDCRSGLIRDWRGPDLPLPF